jgi:hypothetical protein
VCKLACFSLIPLGEVHSFMNVVRYCVRICVEDPKRATENLSIAGAEAEI